MRTGRFAVKARMTLRLVTIALTLVASSISVLAREGEIERHWSEPVYKSELQFQLCMIGGAVALFCVVKAVWGLMGRRRAN